MKLLSFSCRTDYQKQVDNFQLISVEQRSCACQLPGGETVKEGLYEVVSDPVMLLGVSG